MGISQICLIDIYYISTMEPLYASPHATNHTLDEPRSAAAPGGHVTRAIMRGQWVYPS
jgi:hypothetical protein